MISRNLNRRLVGDTFIQLKRDRYIAAKMEGLTDQEYRLWDLLEALVDWNPRHEERYNRVTIPDGEMAEILGWSLSKVWRTRKGLVEKNFISEVGSQTFSLMKSYRVDSQFPKNERRGGMKRRMSPMN
jgi:hypothetical protein